MNFSARIRRSGEVTIVDLTGHLTSFANGALRQTLADLLKQGRREILVNVSGLQYLDSSGVGELVQCYLNVIKLGGEMKVVGLTDKIDEIFKITKLHRIFPEFSDEQAALQSFPDNSGKGLA